MKKIYLIGILLSLLACEDILKEQPKSIVSENFYTSAADYETAVNAIFNPLRSWNGFGFLYPCQLEAYSDFTHGRGSYSILSDFQGLNSTNISRIGQMWEQFYLAIRNANLVITNAVEATDVTGVSQYEAEARFMRAFIYFHMIRNWGKLVLHTEANFEEGAIPLSSSDDVYTLIITDLQSAEQNLPDSPSSAGRPTKWSAKAVLTDVYFTRGEYTNAENKAKEIIQSNKFSLVAVETVDDFQNLYGPDLVSTSEEIFYLKNNRESGWPYVQFLHHPSDPYYNSGGLFALYMDTVQYTVWSKWDNADLRKKLWYPWQFGLGVHTMLNNKFMDTQRVTDGGNDNPFYRYADILLMYSEAVARNNNGPTSDAMEKLNMIHRRGYGKNPHQSSEVDFNLSQYSDLQSFLDLLLLERGYETYLEGGKRWLDLKRLGRDKARDVIKKGTGKDIADKHFLWPIPSNEMDLNDAIEETEQNPGY